MKLRAQSPSPSALLETLEPRVLLSLTNGGFEAGTLSSWTVAGSGNFQVNTTSPQQGTYDVYYAASLSDQGLWQGSLDLLGGVTYTLSAYYRVDQASVNAEGWRYAEVGFYPSGGPSWGNHLARTTLDDNTTTSGWVQATVQYTPSSNGTYSVGFMSWQTDAIYGLDSFAVTGGDTTAPAAVSNLSTSNATSSSIQLNWTAPGDDGSTGTATSYDIRYSTSAINDGNWASATQVSGEPTPQAAGTGQSMTVSGLSASTTYYFAMKTSDEVPNVSGISNSPSGTTTQVTLLTNGGFENGNLNGWTVNGGTFSINTTSPQAGTYDVYYAASLSDQRLYQGSLSLTQGTTYTLTGYYRVDQASVNAEGWRFAEIGFYPSGGPSWGNYLARTQINDNATTSGWVQATVQYTPSSSGTYSIGFASWYTDAIYGLDSFSVTSGTGSDTTAPAAVSNLSTSNPTSSSIQLNWTAPGDDGSTGTATSYDIRYSTSAINEGNWASATQVSGEPTPAAAGTGQNMTVSGLSASTTYYFAIKTSDEVPNVSAISNSPSGTTSAAADTTAPAAVSNLSTSNPTSSSIQLNWTAPGDDGSTGTATSYDIRYRTGGAVNDSNWASATQVTGEPTPASAGTGQSMTVSGLSGETTYYFAIKTSDEVPNVSAISNSPSGTTTDTVAPAAVTNLATSNATSNSIQLSWTAPGDNGSTGTATSYDIRYRTGGAVNDSNWASATQVTGEPTPQAAGTGQSMTVSGLSASTTYYFAIKTSDEVPNVSGISNSPSGATTAAPDTTAPAAVSNLSTSNITASSIQLNWTAPGDDGSTGTATSYDIRYSTSAITDGNWASATQVSGEPTPAAAGTGQSMTVSGLSGDTTYYFAMKTADEVPNWSGLSNVPNAKTSDTVAPAAVSNLAAGSPTTSSLQLTWTAPGDNGTSGTASSYDIRYSTSAINDGNWASATQVSGEPTPASAGTNQNMTVSGLNANTTYYFAIKTSDEASNWSGISNSPSGTTSQAISNLLTNGSFENGNLNGWTVNGGTFSINTTAPQQGTYDVYYAASLSDQRLYQGGLSLTGGVTYTLSMYYRIDQASVNAESWRFAEIGFYPSGGPSWGNYLARTQINDNATTSGWVQATVQYTPSSSGTYSIGFASWSTDAIYGLDNFVVNDGSGGSDTTAPAAVSNLSTSNPTSSSIQLNWTAPGDDGSTGTATSYDIRYRTGGAVNDSNWASATQVTGEPTPASAGTGQSMTVSGLSAGTTYYFAIKTSDEVPNVSAISNSPSGTTSAAADTTAPAAVSNLSTSNPTSSSIQLNWTAPGDDGSTGTATSYDIRYSTSAINDGNWASATQVSGEPTPAAAGTGQNMTVSGLSPNTTYYFAMKTADEVPNWSGISNSPSGTTQQQTLTNLLTNPGFETGSLTGWNAGAGYTASTADKHSGTYSARSANADMNQVVSTTIGQTYKYTAWMKIASESGSDWGGFRMEVQDANWQTLVHSGYFTQGSHGSEWFEIGITFTATTTTSRIYCGYYGGSGRTMTVYADDLMTFQKPVTNTAPTISVMSVSPSSITDLPVTQNFSVTADDPDGAIEKIYWEFGDGARAYTASGSRRVGAPGSYTATVHVVDDEDAVTTQTVTWSATDSAFPGVSVNSTPSQTTSSSLSVSGTASGSGLSVKISTDRGELVAATGTTSWSASVPLKPGNNRLTIQVADSGGEISTVERLVRYAPSASLAVSSLAESASSVERWEVIETTFQVDNSAATHTQFPYDANPAPGLEWVDGITVDAVFWNTASPSVTYRRPAFVYQDYQRQEVSNREWLYPNDNPVWMARFSPPSTGTWNYRIEVTEAKGSVNSSTRSFTATTPTDPDNHGPVVVSSSDSRYFQYADGTTFLGAGTGIGFGRQRYSYEAIEMMNTMGNGDNQDYFRWWISGDIWGSAWSGWSSRTLSYEGNVPATGLSLDAGYGDGLAAMKLDSTNPIMFQGFGENIASVISGRTYKMRIRWRGENITGPSTGGQPFGMVVKFTGWPEPGQTGSLPVAIAHEYGDSGWHVSEATFVANSSFIGSGSYNNVAIILENTTGGTAWVDEISCQEVLTGGALGPNLLFDSKLNAYMEFDPRHSYGLDTILEAAADNGMTFKLVIEEKQEYLLNHWGTDGLPDKTGGEFNRDAGAPTYDLHEYYWRYLMGRYGAYRSVQSWELVNEENPNNSEHFDLATHLADLADNDGNPHLASTSTWASLAASNWKDSAHADLDYVDFHCYVRGTGWIEPETDLANDSARFFHEYDLDAYEEGFGKPIVWGEMGIDGTGGTDGEDPGVANDTNGIWLHKILWARTGSGGVIPLYWYTDNIFSKSLHYQFGDWKDFMDGIPLAQGGYADASASSSNTNVRVFGQKNMTTRRAHLWIDNKYHTWKNVVDGASMPSQSATITVNLGQANAQYTVQWWNTYTGQVSSTQTLTANSSGVLTLSVSNLATDTAVKIGPYGGGQLGAPAPMAELDEPVVPAIDPVLTYEESTVTPLRRRQEARRRDAQPVLAATPGEPVLDRLALRALARGQAELVDALAAADLNVPLSWQ